MHYYNANANAKSHNGDTTMAQYDEYGNDVELMKKYGQMTFDENVEDGQVLDSGALYIAEDGTPVHETQGRTDTLEEIMADIEQEHRCEHCSIVPTPTDQKHCDKCIEHIVAWLFGAYASDADLAAEIALEQMHTERGLY